MISAGFYFLNREFPYPIFLINLCYIDYRLSTLGRHNLICFFHCISWRLKTNTRFIYFEFCSCHNLKKGETAWSFEDCSNYNIKKYQNKEITYLHRYVSEKVITFESR